MVTEDRENVNNAAAVDGGVNNETLADIVAEMRDEMTGTHYVADGMIESLHRAQSELRALADRLEAALKREKDEIEADALAAGGIVEAERHKPGNAAAMREALGAVYRILEEIQSFTPHLSDVSLMREFRSRVCRAKRVLDVALSAPPRNCDIGTAEEQAERYGRHCDKFALGGMHCETCPCCGKIPFGRCEFAWAQMPYEKGSAE